MIPSPWEAALLSLAAFRIWKLIADDTILDVPREAILSRVHRKGELFITCPWCAGFWISLVFYGAWWAWGDSTLVVATPFAISAAVGLVATSHDRLAA